MMPGTNVCDVPDSIKKSLACKHERLCREIPPDKLCAGVRLLRSEQLYAFIRALWFATRAAAPQ